MDENKTTQKHHLLPFETSVYQKRLAILQTEISTRGLAGLMIFNPENIFWLTGYQTIGYFTFHSLFVSPDELPVVIGRVVNRDLAMAHETIGNFEAIVDTDDPIKILAQYLNNRMATGQVLGIETRSTHFSVSDYLHLSQSITSKLTACDGLIEPHRAIKSDAEIECMKHAARSAEAGLQAAIDMIAPGKTENDVAAAMHYASISAGSEYLGHPPLVVAGETTALCFAMWRRREIKSGDIVLLEAAGCVNRYHVMLSRPVVVGTPTPEQINAAAALQGVLETAIDSIKPGLTSGEIDHTCRQVVERIGLGKYFKHRSAYGIGIGFPPNWSEGHIYAIRPDDPLVIQPGMTFHVIPTLFLDSFGMCFSDSVRVTETGCELLTEFPRRFFTIDG